MKKKIIILILIIFVCTGIITFKLFNSDENAIKQLISFSFDIPNNQIVDKSILEPCSKSEMKDVGVYQMENPINKDAIKKLQGYLTESELENYINNILLPFYMLNYNKKIQMNPQMIKIQKLRNNNYRFEFQLFCEYEKTSLTKKIYGNVRMKKNKISYFKIVDDEGILSL